MRDLLYARASAAADAVAALADSETMLIAGGTELLNWMRLGIVEPARIVDIGELAELDTIALNENMLTIGARATLNAVGENELVRRHAAALAEACLKAASPQVRNRATLGGNVLQKTRCPYFRSEAPLAWACNKRAPGTGCAARHGLNERHAILGWTDACVATQPSDPAVALACLDATAEVIGPHGRRAVPMSEFHVSQAEVAQEASSERVKLASAAHAAQVETRLAHDEMILAYHVPITSGLQSAYVKVRERESYEYALVSAAAALTMDGGRIDKARLALGSVAQKPWRLQEAEAQLAGKRAVREEILPVIRAALSQARPLDHNAYKVTLAANAAGRAILLAGGGG
jgi:xanthine dehydrogenase YagS FAD-binding subunit